MIFFDTSALMALGERAYRIVAPDVAATTTIPEGAQLPRSQIIKFERFAISPKTLTELARLKNDRLQLDSTRNKARKALDLLRATPYVYDVIDPPFEFKNNAYADNYRALNEAGYAGEYIVAAIYLQEELKKSVPGNEVIFYTDDLFTRHCALAMGLCAFTIDNVPTTKPYKGWKEIQLKEGGEDIMAQYYQGDSNGSDNTDKAFPTDVIPSLPLVNEYLIIKGDSGEGDSQQATVERGTVEQATVGLMKWDGQRYAPIKYKNIYSQFAGKIKPLNDQQQLAFDLLQDDNITIKLLLGVYGSGKDFLMINHALSLIEKGVYDRIVWVRNNIEVKDSKPTGYLPGDLNQKLLPFAGPICDNLGGEIGLERAIADGIVELQHLGFMRGRSWKRSIIYSSEAENLTKEHIQLLIGRIGEGSALWLNGDLRQIDGAVFENNNGISHLIDRLAGHPKFGMVYLNITERSETARMADLLD